MKFNIKKFTLIELIIVIVVIGVLAGMALPKFIGTTRDAKVAAMDQDLDTLEKAVILYNSDKGEYPLKASEISITNQGLLDTLSKINDDGSSIYEIDMDKIQPYLEQLKFTDPTTDTYLYSTKTNVAINEQGKIDSNENIHYILNNAINSNNILPKLLFITDSTNTSNSFVLSKTNNLYAWGWNSYGQLGNGNTSTSYTPINISLASGIKFAKISNNGQHTMGIGLDGELYTWGVNWNGRLGDGTTIEKHIPTKITLASGVKPKEISAGYANSMAIGDDGELYAWGYNSYGNVGDGTTKDKKTPTKITLASGVKPIQIYAGYFYSMAIGNDGNLYTWGWNGNGQLGDGTTTDKYTPTKIMKSGTKETMLSGGVDFYGYPHSLMIDENGDLYTWGYNLYGQLGQGTTSDCEPIPTKITLASGVKSKQIAAGGDYSMAIGDDGELYAWGFNSDGLLGDGTTTNKSIPNKITLASGVKPTHIACGGAYSMAIGDDGNLYCWGFNNHGELGDGTTVTKLIPTKINYDFK